MLINIFPQEVDGELPSTPELVCENVTHDR